MGGVLAEAGTEGSRGGDGRSVSVTLIFLLFVFFISVFCMSLFRLPAPFVFFSLFFPCDTVVLSFHGIRVNCKTMDQVEEMLSALMPTLEAHEIERWEPGQVELLCAMLKEYGSQARASAKGKEPHELHSSDASVSGEEEEEEGGADKDDKGDEAQFVEAVSEVDRDLGVTREFLKSRLPYGTQPEPARIPGSDLDAAASPITSSTSPSKKRARSPEGSGQVTVVTANGTVPAPVYVVDSFLYTEDDIEALVHAKKIAREYCTRCGCTEVALTDFITHSFSQDQLLYLSCFLFPHVLQQCIAASAEQQATTKTAKRGGAPLPLSIVDVGSRLGVVLWACAFALQQGALVQPQGGDDADGNDDDGSSEEAKKEPEVHITGVEMDPTYVKVSQDVLRRFFMPRRRRAPKLGSASRSGPTVIEEQQECEEAMNVSPYLHLVQSDCFEGAGAEALSRASVVVLHNVFEYFCASPVEHARCWLKLRSLIGNRSQFLVCSPALEETLAGFTPEVWASAWAGAKGLQASPAVPAQEWLASFVEQVNVAEIADDFLSMRALLRDVVNGPGGCCDGDCHNDDHSRDDHHSHSHSHGHHHSGCRGHAGGTSGASKSGTDEDTEEDEVAEQIHKIYVYRVL
jgi:hypothetical protein